MSLRGFLLWFWGIVIGTGIAGGATLAVLRAPENSASPPPVPLAAVPIPPLAPALAVAGEHRQAAPWSGSRPAATRAVHRPRDAQRAAPELPRRITVVPPIPPEPVALRPGIERERVAHLTAYRRVVRVKPRARTAPEEVSPPPRPPAYAYSPGYRRYSYDTYTYTDPYYPYRFSYYYRY